jgi:chemotaxis protein CheZ
MIVRERRVRPSQRRNLIKLGNKTLRKDNDRESMALIVDFLQSKGRTNIKLDDIVGLAETMAKTLDHSVRRVDVELHEEFCAITSEISSLRREIYDLRPDQMRFERIPEAGRELDVVIEATEEATHVIMEAAEVIMAASDADPVAYKALVDDKMIAIFEACTFQDLTGQRLRKVVKTLSWIENRITSLAEKLTSPSDTPPPALDSEETADERRDREQILNGPQMKGQGVTQELVDDFFAKSDQGDIDRLFA